MQDVFEIGAGFALKVSNDAREPGDGKANQYPLMIRQFDPFQDFDLGLNTLRRGPAKLFQPLSKLPLPGTKIIALTICQARPVGLAVGLLCITAFHARLRADPLSAAIAAEIVICCKGEMVYNASEAASLARSGTTLRICNAIR